MKNVKIAFTKVVEQIINQELHSIQQDLYAIEGLEIISSLFENNQYPDYEDNNELVFDFGFSPDALEIKETVISFTDVIDSCYSLLEANRRQTGNEEVNSIDSWKAILTERQTHPSLIELLCYKYKTDINGFIQ